MDPILDHCDGSGEKCQMGCPEAVKKLREEHPCIRLNWEYISDAYKTTAHPTMIKFLKAMESCINRQPAPNNQGQVDPMKGSASLFMDIIKQLDARPLLQNIIMNVNYNYGASKAEEDEHNEMWH